jgi:hypothetical protein
MEAIHVEAAREGRQQSIAFESYHPPNFWQYSLAEHNKGGGLLLVDKHYQLEKAPYADIARIQFALNPVALLSQRLAISNPRRQAPGFPQV